MKIYFTASIVGKRQYLPNYLKIVDYLKNIKHDVVSDHILQTSENQIKIENKEDRIAFQNRLENWISSCDVFIAETSFPSISVGYEISLAAHLNKPILILFSEGNPPSLLAHHKDDRIICERYSADTLNQIIDDFLLFSQDQADSRFTFYISSKINSFLDRISQRKKMPKSVYLRSLIEKEMHSDPS